MNLINEGVLQPNELDDRDERNEEAEAALKRERGNSAALREACAKAAESAAEIMERVRHKDGLAFNTANYIAGVARTALAAPPRNCDLARDWVRDLYAHFQPPASIKREMPPEWVDSVMAFCQWLVAPAAGKEGGAK